MGCIFGMLFLILATSIFYEFKIGFYLLIIEIILTIIMIICGMKNESKNTKKVQSKNVDKEYKKEDTISEYNQIYIGQAVFIPIFGESTGIVMGIVGDMALVQSNTTHKQYTVPIATLKII